MRYSIEPRDICRIYVEPRIYLKGYGFYHFPKILIHIHLKLLKARVIGKVKNFLIVLKNLQQMQ